MANHFIGNIIRIAYDFYFCDTDSDDDEHVLLEKVDNYAETTVPYMSDRQFKLHFRMSPETFEDLLQKLNLVYMQNTDYPRKGHPSISLDKAAMILIWYLGNLESFRYINLNCFCVIYIYVF